MTITANVRSDAAAGKDSTARTGTAPDTADTDEDRFSVPPTIQDKHISPSVAAVSNGGDGGDGIHHNKWMVDFQYEFVGSVNLRYVISYLCSLFPIHDRTVNHHQSSPSHTSSRCITLEASNTFDVIFVSGLPPTLGKWSSAQQRG